MIKTKFKQVFALRGGCNNIGKVSPECKESAKICFLLSDGYVKIDLILDTTHALHTLYLHIS